MQQSSDTTCHNYIRVVCLICPWSWSLVLKTPTPRKPCTSKHYSLRYGECCVFSHNFCIFPSISVPSRSYNQSLLPCRLSEPPCSPCRLWVSSQISDVINPGHPVLFANCSWRFSYLCSLLRTSLPTSPTNSTAHLLPPTCGHLSICSFSPPLSPFLFCLLRIQNIMCSLLDVKTCVWLRVDSVLLIFPSTLH